MSAAVTLKMLLLAEDHAGKVLKKVGVEVDETGKRHADMGKVAETALLGMGVAAVGFANSSINKFKQVTVESRGLQRAMGGTLEEASRMREAAILAGVDYGTFQKSMFKLDKTLVASNDNGKKHAAMVQLLGQDYLDANGKVKPMSELLPQISDKFAGMKDGPEKSALAMQLFGKAGTAMLPFLGKGSAGIAELEKQSDKFGTTLSGSALDSLAKSKEQTRLWQAGMDGLKVQIGAQLLPILNKLVGFIQQYVIPIIQKITAFVREHKQAVMLAVVVIGTLILGMKAWAIAQGILNTVMALNPIALVVIAIAALAAGLIYAYKHSETFRKIVQTAFQVVKTVVMAVWNGYLKPTFAAWKAVILGIGAAAVWLWHNAIQPAWDGIKAIVQGAWNYVIKPVASAIATAWSAISDGLKTAWGFIENVFGWIKSGIRAVRDVVHTVVGAISTAFHAIGDALKWVYDHTIGPILDTISGAINGVKNALSDLVDTAASLGSGGHIHTGGTATGGPSFGGGGTVPHGAKASGGRVYAGRPYLVGEERPEMFVPDVNGTIAPRVPRSIDNGPAAAKLDTRSLEREIRRLGDRLDGMKVTLDGYAVGRVMGSQVDRLGRGH